MNKIAGPVERVVVVGAGIARLAAASRLRQAGIDAVVLEARDRIGGRLHTVDLAGTPVDMGGSWIHHPIGNPLTAFCDDHGIARDAGNPLPSLSAFDMAERRRLDHAEVEFYAQTETDAFWDSTEALSQRLGPGASAHDAIETYVAERGLSPTVARRLRQELRAELEANAADSAENQSLRWISLAEVFEGELWEQRAVRLRRRRLRQRPSRRSTPDVRRELDRVGLGEPCYVFHIFGCTDRGAGAGPGAVEKPARSRVVFVRAWLHAPVHVQRRHSHPCATDRLSRDICVHRKPCASTSFNRYSFRVRGGPATFATLSN